MNGKETHVNTARFRIVDLLVIILCLAVVVYSLNLFRLDLFQTLSLQNEQPVGTIVIRENIVQRRLADRVLWDRLAVESPVYLGDLIRVADHSAATLFIEAQQIDLDENTLIRIQLAPGEDGVIQIELSEGNLGMITTAEGSNIQLSLMGYVIEAAPNTTLTAAAGIDGIAVQVTEGSAVFTGEGQSREVRSGTMLAFDTAGIERHGPAAVVTQPRPNARYVKSVPQPLDVVFEWNRINLQPGERIRLEIAEDRNFSRDVKVFNNLDTFAEVALGAGIWNWRLSSVETILSTGKLTVVEASGLDLLSPARGSLFSYHGDKPSLSFQWSEIEGASHYVIEISSTPDFTTPSISKEVAAAFFVDSELGEGIWYWRVQPAFSSLFKGSAAFSPVSFFIIEQNIAGGALAVTMLGQDQIEEIEQIIDPSRVVEPEIPEPVPILLRLLTPAQGARLAGLTALRTQTLFTWAADGEVQRSRFVLSRNRNPLQGQPTVEIINPGSTIALNRLETGIWYWTVEAQSANGLISVAEPRQLQVQPIPLLAMPANRVPLNGHDFDIEQIRIQRNIVFRWSSVSGANAYVFTLFEQTAGGRRQVNSAIVTTTSWTLEDVSILGRGTFIWQVEAINRRNNIIEQRGVLGVNSFTIDVPQPRPVQMEDPGVLYGF
ncbi:MAG: hypothetical protein FWD87_09860 [Spirochaetaceae bacterium]|nr:hypothetical protein [Spirochaetaceae bacterium]